MQIVNKRISFFFCMLLALNGCLGMRNAKTSPTSFDINLEVNCKGTRTKDYIKPVNKAPELIEIYCYLIKNNDDYNKLLEFYLTETDGGRQGSLVYVGISGNADEVKKVEYYNFNDLAKSIEYYFAENERESEYTLSVI